MRRRVIGQFWSFSQLLRLDLAVTSLAIAIALLGLAPLSRAADNWQTPSASQLSMSRDQDRDGTRARLVASQVQTDDRTRQIVLEVPLHGQSTLKDMMMQVEALIQKTLAQQFRSSVSQTSGRSVQAVDRVQVMVLANRNGTVLPIVSVTVSRAQWYQQPQAKAWLQYYASQTLLQPQSEQMTVAIAPPAGQPSGAVREKAISNSPTRTEAIHRAFDDGQLTGSIAQDYLNDLD